MPEPTPDLQLRFSHAVIAVTDMDRALHFYRDVLGMQVVFDQTLAGEPFDSALGASNPGQDGRAVGGLLGGASIELLHVSSKRNADNAPRRGGGIQLLSFSVTDLDGTYARLQAAIGESVQQPFEIGGVRMFFATDPDGTVIELVEFPGAARTPAEFHGADG